MLASGWYHTEREISALALLAEPDATTSRGRLLGSRCFGSSRFGDFLGDRFLDGGFLSFWLALDGGFAACTRLNQSLLAGFVGFKAAAFDDLIELLSHVEFVWLVARKTARRVAPSSRESRSYSQFP